MIETGDIIRNNRKKKGLTQEELGKIIGVKKAAVQKWESGAVENLKRSSIKSLADYFEISPTELMGMEEEEIKFTIPVVGLVAAGKPRKCEQDELGNIEISKDLAKRGDYMALEVDGPSMEPYILLGDIIIVRKQNTIETGDVAVIMVNGENATVKKIKKHATGISLIPYNHDCETFFYTNEECETLPVQIIGKVVEMRRKFR